VTLVPQELFGSAVAQYARYRPGYPQELLDIVAARTGLDGGQRVLDIGCGSGQIAIRLARHASEVVAIDPLPGMLAQGRAAARAAGVPNITWRQGDDGQVAALAGAGAHVAVFAASFHWTDRPAVLAALDRVLDPGGAVVVINDVLGDDEEPDWVAPITELRTRYLGGWRDFCNGLPGGHADVLAASPFSVVDTLHWSWSRRLTVDEVVGLQLTYSVSTPERLGDRAGAFTAEVREAVLALHPDGVVTQPLRVEALIATRPDASEGNRIS
jgi:SAM-dependent methyltransferase